LLPAIFVYFAANSHYNNGMAKNGDTKSSGNSGGARGVEATLWSAAEKLKGKIHGCTCRQTLPLALAA